MKKARLIYALLFLFNSLHIFAQPGALDPTFGVGGIITNYGLITCLTNASTSILQADDKLIIVGIDNYGEPENEDFKVIRFNADGTFDNSFGNEGKVITNIGGGNADIASSVAIQADGKIVVAGWTRNDSLGIYDIALVRYYMDGTIDSTFNNDGILTINIGILDEAYSVAIQPDGKIVVTGTTKNPLSNQNDILILRLNTDGTLDVSFDNDGIVTTDINNNSNDIAHTVVIQPDGKIDISGISYFSVNFDNLVCLARYNSDGSLDNSFDMDGITTLNINVFDRFSSSMVLQPDGKILVVAGNTDYADFFWGIIRYNVDGSLDQSFNTNGFLYGADMDLHSIALQTDGKLIVAGRTGSFTHSDFAIERFLSDGSLDSSFGMNGLVTTNISFHIDIVISVAIQSNNKILAMGSSGGSNTLARYLSGLEVGTLDFSLSDNAAFIYPNPITRQATLSYSLKQEETLSIQLSDMQGRLLATYLDHQKQQAGDHSQTILFPPDLPNGAYLLVISNGKGKVSVKMVK